MGDETVRNLPQTEKGREAKFTGHKGGGGRGGAGGV